MAVHTLKANLQRKFAGYLQDIERANSYQGSDAVIDTWELADIAMVELKRYSKQLREESNEKP